MGSPATQLRGRPVEGQQSSTSSPADRHAGYPTSSTARPAADRWIDLGMHQLGAAVIPEALLRFQLTGEDERRGASHEPGARFSSVVRAGGEDRWLAVTAFSDQPRGAARHGGREARRRAGGSASLLGAIARRRRRGGSPAGGGRGGGTGAGRARPLRGSPAARSRLLRGCRLSRRESSPADRQAVSVARRMLYLAGPRLRSDFGEAAPWLLEEVLDLDARARDALRQSGV